MTAPRLSEVECLRGLAITLVLLHHLSGLIYGGHLPTNLGLPWPAATIVLTGYTGVDLFFVLSGFLLSRPFLAEARGGSPVGRATYAARRVLRVMPLYVLAVLVGSVLVAESPRDVLAGLPYLVFLNALPNVARPMPPHSAPWWSLATEAQFYILLPFLPLVLRTTRGRRVGVVLLAAYAALNAALSLQWVRPPTLAAMLALSHSLVGRGPLFLAGIAAAWLYDREAEGLRAWAARHATWARVAGDVLLVAGLVGLLLLLEWVAQVDYVTREAEWPLWHVGEGVLWATVLLALVLLPGSLKSLLVNRAWGFIGLISYSLYLVHTPTIFYGRRRALVRWPYVFPWIPGTTWPWTWPRIVAPIGLVVASLAVATLTYYAIERPMLRLKTRVGR